MADEIHRLPNGLRYAVTRTRHYQLPVFFLEYYLYGPGPSNNALLSYKNGDHKTVHRYTPALLQIIHAFQVHYARDQPLTLIPVLRSFQSSIQRPSVEQGDVLEHLASSLGIQIGYEVFSQEPRSPSHKDIGYIARLNRVFQGLRCSMPPKGILLIDDMINTSATIEAYHKCAHISDGAVVGAVTLMKNAAKAMLNPDLLR